VAGLKVAVRCLVFVFQGEGGAAGLLQARGRPWRVAPASLVGRVLVRGEGGGGRRSVGGSRPGGGRGLPGRPKEEEGKEKEREKENGEKGKEKRKIEKGK
jgi:hypothetical protein